MKKKSSLLRDYRFILLSVLFLLVRSFPFVGAAEEEEHGGEEVHGGEEETSLHTEELHGGEEEVEPVRSLLFPSFATAIGIVVYWLLSRQ